MTPVLYIHISMLLFSLDLCTSSPKSHPTEAFITKQSGDSFFLGSTLSNLEVWPEIQRLGQNVGSSQIEGFVWKWIATVVFFSMFLTVENVRPHLSPLLFLKD